MGPGCNLTSAKPRGGEVAPPKPLAGRHLAPSKDGFVFVDPAHFAEDVAADVLRRHRQAGPRAGHRACEVDGETRWLENNRRQLESRLAHLAAARRRRAHRSRRAVRPLVVTGHDLSQ